MTTTTSWIEDSATMTDNGKITFEHSDKVHPHKIRKVHLDGTPIGEWSDCDDCDTITGDKAIITYLRQAFEDCEQIAADNPTDKNVARLLTALHDQFDVWMRDDQGHKDLIHVLNLWMNTCELVIVQDQS